MRCPGFILFALFWSVSAGYSPSFADGWPYNAARVVIVANQDVTEAIDDKTLRDITLLNKRYWHNGAPVRLVVLPEKHELHSAFIAQKLAIFPYQLDRAWQRRIYAGLADPPIRVESMEEMLAVVRRTSGAIGYVDSSIDTSSSNVRIWP